MSNIKIDKIEFNANNARYHWYISYTVESSKGIFHSGGYAFFKTRKQLRKFENKIKNKKSKNPCGV